MDVRVGLNGTNLGLFLKISFSTFWLLQSQMCPIWGQYDQILMQKVTSLLASAPLSLMYVKVDRLDSNLTRSEQNLSKLEI